MSETIGNCVALGVDWPSLAQMITALAAVAALGVGPWLAFNASRRLAVAQSRQYWLDGLRSDVAELISLHEEEVIFRAKVRLKTVHQDMASTRMQRIGMLRAQIRMRLNIAEERHRALNETIKSFISNYDQKNPKYNPNLVIKAVDPIAQEVWADIKKARV